MPCVFADVVQGAIAVQLEVQSHRQFVESYAGTTAALQRRIDNSAALDAGQGGKEGEAAHLEEGRKPEVLLQVLG